MSILYLHRDFSKEAHHAKVFKFNDISSWAQMGSGPKWVQGPNGPSWPRTRAQWDTVGPN